MKDTNKEKTADTVYCISKAHPAYFVLQHTLVGGIGVDALLRQTVEALQQDEAETRA